MHRRRGPRAGGPADRERQMSNIQKFQMYIGGEWCDPASGEWFESYNPYTGQVWAEIPRGSAADAERAVAGRPTAPSPVAPGRA